MSKHISTIKLLFFIYFFCLPHLYLSAAEQSSNAQVLHADSILHYTIRKATLLDQDNLKILYHKVASMRKGLARTKEEISDEYVNKILHNGRTNGLALVVDHDEKIKDTI